MTKKIIRDMGGGYPVKIPENSGRIRPALFNLGKNKFRPGPINYFSLSAHNGDALPSCIFNCN